MFTNENEDFIRWMEDLETHTCRYIYDRREKWFESEMELTDIENYFASPLKIYKSGKFYLARTNINTRLGKISLKIYDENEQDIDPDTIGENTQIITILEVQGIKCSARSFQIEIEIKQMMVLRPSDLFERCILGSGNKSVPPPSPSLFSPLPRQEEEPLESSNEAVQEEQEEEEEPLESSNATEAVQDPDTLEQNEFPHNNVNDSDILEEFDIELHLDEVPSTETIQIKARNEIYYKMYHDARQKAKLARQMALAAYLEAKQIKNTYMLDDVESEESEGEGEEV